MKGITDISTVRTDANVVLTRELLLKMYWRSHPRYIFFKSVPRNSVFLELGAHDGELSFWKNWLHPSRNDIKMYGVDLSLGKSSDRYERFDVADLNNCRLDFDDHSVDVIYATHVFEHLSNVPHIIEECSRVLRNGGG